MMTEAAPVVARCEKCGREFVAVGGDPIDRYPPLGSKRGVCGGRIVALPDWDDLRGGAPDATGGLSSEAFVRELRDSWRE